MNHPTTGDGEKLVAAFTQDLQHQISKRGFWPLPMSVLLKSGKIEPVSLKTSDVKALEVFCKACQHPETIAAIVGTDHTSPEECKTEMQSVLAVVLYETPNSLILDPSTSVRLAFKFGIVNYNYSPRAIRPIDWTNSFWIGELRHRLYSMIPDVSYSGEMLGRRIASTLVH